MKLTLAIACTITMAYIPALHATPFDGAYDASIDRCYRPSDTRFILQGNSTQSWESGCTLTNPTSIRGIPNAVLYDATCNGEGETFSYRMMLVGNTPVYAAGGTAEVNLQITTNSASWLLVRCPRGVGMNPYQ